jgi:hypothetical protein
MAQGQGLHEGSPESSPPRRLGVPPALNGTEQRLDALLDLLAVQTTTMAALLEIVVERLDTLGPPVEIQRARPTQDRADAQEDVVPLTEPDQPPAIATRRSGPPIRPVGRRG